MLKWEVQNISVATNKRKSKKRSFMGDKYTKSQGGTDDMSSADKVDGNGSAVISGEPSTSSSAPANVLNSSASKIDLSYLLIKHLQT